MHRVDLLDTDDQTGNHLPPARINAVTMALTGTGGWLVATVVLAVAQSRGAAVPEGWVDVCLAGIGLGGLGLVWGVTHERRAGQEEP